MTLLHLFIFAIILFLVYHSYIFGLVRLDLYTSLGSYSIYPSDPWVNDRYCVGVVLIPYLSAIVPYMPDRGVVRGSDSSIDSYIVPLSCIGLAEQHYYRGVLGILNANRKIRKLTDTDVAFTREYSRVSIFHRERECTN